MHPTRAPRASAVITVDHRRIHADTAGVWQLTLTLLLSIVIPLYLVANTDDVGRSSGWLLALPVVVWSGWRIAGLIGAGSENCAVLMFWIFNYIFLGLAPLVQVRTGLLPTTTENVSALFDERAMVVILASLAAFEIGRKFSQARDPLATTSSSPQRTCVSARVVARFCWAGLLLSWAYLARVGVANVVGSRVTHRDARSFVWPDPTVAEIAYAAAFVPLLIAAHLLLLGRTRADLVSSPATRRVLVMMVFATLAVVVNLFGSPRYIFGAVWLSILVQKRIAQTVRRRRLFNLAIAAGFLFVFPIADKFSRPGASHKKFEALDVFQGSGDYDSFAQTNNSLNMVAHIGYSYGRQLLGVVFFWVPRRVWSGKPDDTGIVIAEFMKYRFRTLSAPLVSELYVNGGYLLVVAGFVGIGYVLSRSLGRAESANSAALCIVACVVPFYSPILLRGSLLQATGFAALFALCIVVLRRLAQAPVHIARVDEPASL